jgi:tRNA(Ile2)-agmatinylcytidine synthase
MLDCGGFFIYIGIDDTDSVSAMCTTYLASELVIEFSEWDVIGYPRLVRLNPNIPWKTRGNGAITVRLGKGHGKRFLIGNIEGEDYFSYPQGDYIDIPDAKKRIQRIIEANAQFSDENTNPAFVIMKKKPSPALYWKAVREVVELKDVKKLLKIENADFKGYKNQRGLVGATSAISWRPRDKTYEVIVYREKKRWGTKRKVDTKSVIAMDRKFSSTFNNYDYRNKEVAITPNSPCPVLFGIRGDETRDLLKAKEIIKSEKKDRWILFETNQGTDEHLQRKSIGKISKFSSAITSGRVSLKPRTIMGGHVIFELNNGGTIDCAAYEPTKEFRVLVRKLALGDLVTVYGGVREDPMTINIEKIRIGKLIPISKKVQNPMCKKCKKSMKSIGKGVGYRCIKCGDKKGEEMARYKREKRDIKTGFYEVPVCARRHLAKPLSRY